MSVVAPAGNGTMIRMFLAGKRSWPRATAGTSAIAPATTAAPTNSRRVPAWTGNGDLPCFFRMASPPLTLSRADSTRRLVLCCGRSLLGGFHAIVVHGCEHVVGRFEQPVKILRWRVAGPHIGKQLTTTV